MSQEIIKPEGKELLRYLNDGYAICNKCGALMDYKADLPNKYFAYVCPACGWEIDTMDYEYEDDADEAEWTDEMLGFYDDDVPPAGCRACGGPYPSCKSSCKLFDD